MKLNEKLIKNFWGRTFREKNGCRKWWGEKNKRGYCLFSVSEKKIRAQRFIYEQEKEPIPPGFEIYNECGELDCVEPSHLQALSRKENFRRKAEHGVFRGEKNGRTDMTEADVVAIILMHQELKIPVTKIGGETRIPLSTIYSYISGQAWSHVRLPPTPLELEEYLRVYISGYLPEKDSPYSPKIRSLLQDFKNKNG